MTWCMRRVVHVNICCKHLNPISVNNTSVRKYWKILFYPPNTDTGTFYRGSTDIDTDAQYPEFNTDIKVIYTKYSKQFK